MKDHDKIDTAWEIWNLIARFNDLIWDQYEDEFIERYLKDEEEKYWQDQALNDFDSF